MFGNVLAVLMLLQSATQPAPKDEIRDSLARSRELFNEARFSESIQLLTGLSDELLARPDRLSDKVNTKMQLALANIGLNDNEKAKAYLVEMYTLDPNVTLDAQQYSPKVISLFADAKATMVRIRCQAIGEDAKNSLRDGNAAAIRRLIASPDSSCIDMVAFSTPAADMLYKAGLEAYKNSDFSIALQNFQAALKYSPKHELAAPYVDLAQGRLQVAEDRTLIQFQKNFDAQNFKDASQDYRQLLAFNDARNSQAIRQADDRYRKELKNLVETWNQTCPGGDASAMNDIRGEISALIPEPAFGTDIRALMMPCDKPELKADVRPPTRQDVRLEVRNEGKPDVKTASKLPVSQPGTELQCLQLDYRVAMTRLKIRVEPEIPREARTYIQGGNQVTVRVKVHIDENGNVASSVTPGGNPIFNTAVKTAVDRWKFSPAMDADGPRCVDTEIPLAIGPLTTH